MGLFNLFKRISKGSPLTHAEVDGNWDKIENAFPTPAAGTADVGKALVLNAAKTGFDYATIGAGGGGNATLKFTADPSLDIALHKNRLVMADNGVAKLANVSGGGVGAKGKYRIDTNSLPQYPVGAIYEMDFMGVNFNDGDEVVIPIIEQQGMGYNQYYFRAKNSPTEDWDFQIGADLTTSLTSLLSLWQTTQIGAWVVSINGTKIVFRNNHILTGIGVSTNYGLPEYYNNIQAGFIRRDIQPFDNRVDFSILGTFTEVRFNLLDGSGGTTYPLGNINGDNHYPIIAPFNNYFISDDNYLRFYNGSTYEDVTGMYRDEAGFLFLISASFSGNPNSAADVGIVFPVWTGVFQENLGTNYTITQTRQGIDGIIQSWVDGLLENGSQGFMIYLNDGNCSQTLAIHAFGMMGDFTSIGISQGDYSSWSIPTTTLELSKIIKANFEQNPNSFFNVTADGHTNNEAWIEIEEKSVQTDNGCNPQMLTWYQSVPNNDAFSTWFVRELIQAPVLGTAPMLTKPILGFLQDIVNGEALISDNNINLGVVENIAENELTQAQLDLIDTDFNNVYNCSYVLGTDGQMKKFSLFNENEFNNMALSLILMGGASFLLTEATAGGGTGLFRRFVFVGN